ncbi:MAG: hypothetical protein ACRCZS_25335 [Chroococcidiopsis sp.]
MTTFQVGDIVRLKHISDFPIGGWLHNELAVVYARDYSQQMLVVKLKNKLLRDSVKQDIAERGTIIVSFANLTKC